MRHPSRFLKSAGVGVLAALVDAPGLYQFYEPGWRYTIRGVDVSRHKGVVDWDALAAEQTIFAYIKATEGGDWTDPRFAENWLASEEAGILRGAYHFYTLCTPGSVQAAHLLATVPNTEGMLPPAVGLEFRGNCSARPTVGEFRAELAVFLSIVETEYQMRPVIYTNTEFYKAYLAEDPPLDVLWWVASPLWVPRGEPEWTFWQYFPGDRDGVAGRVDRNVFNGDDSALNALLRQPSG